MSISSNASKSYDQQDYEQALRDARFLIGKNFWSLGDYELDKKSRRIIRSYEAEHGRG